MKECLPTLLCVVPISIMAGQVLYSKEDLLVAIPSLLILIPPFVDSIGDLTSVLSARITTALQLGTIEPTFRRSGVLLKNIGIAFVAGSTTFTFIGVLTYLIATALNWKRLEVGTLILACFTSGILVTSLLIVVALLAAFGTYKHGWDPDNVVAPILSTIGDFIGVSSLIIVLGILGVF